MIRPSLNRVSLLLAVILVTALGGNAHAVVYDLLVSSVNTNSILRYNGSTGVSEGRFDHFSGANNPLANPFGMAFSLDGTKVFVASLGNASILQYDAVTGNFQRTIATAADGIYLPNDLQVGQDGNLYVANYGSNSILRFSTGTTPTLLGTFATSAPGAQGQANYNQFMTGPTGIAFGRDTGGSQVLYVSGSLTNTVVKLDSTGRYLSTIYSQALSNLNPLVNPSDIAVNPVTNNVAMSSYRNPGSPNPVSGNRVVIQNPNAIQAGGISTVSSASLSGPAGLAFSPNDPTKLLIASYDNNQILSATATGSGSSEAYTIDPTPFISSTQATASGLNGPIYMTFFPSTTQAPSNGGISAGVASVPEPASIALTGLGLTLLVGYSLRRRKSA